MINLPGNNRFVTLGGRLARFHAASFTRRTFIKDLRSENKKTI